MKRTPSDDRDVSDEFGMFIDASKRARLRGDYKQAERLLKTGLRRAEQSLLAAENATRDVLENLMEVYELQDKETHARTLETRFAQLLNIAQDERYSELIKERRETE